MLLDYNIAPASHTDFQLKMSEQVHYFHGVNPLRIVYLTNMYDFGAEHSANEMFHNWFTDGSIYDNALNSAVGPPPGYIVGGPNASFSDPAISPPAGQPQQKSYLDFNTGYPDPSWEITEPAIYYQSSYIRLLSNAMGKEAALCTPCPNEGLACNDGNPCTINDTYDENCNCIGEFEDTDYDGICDAEDQCPGEDDLIDENENGIPDACDDCTQAGQSCDDNDACTINDVYDVDCNCAGTIADADNDGVCDADDQCPGGDDSVDIDEDGIPDACDNCTQAGESCDDGNACTINDVYDAACNCAGTIADTDNDGVCDADDQCPGGDDSMDTDEDGVPDACDNCTQAGESCDDGNACTINDVYDAACNCAGTIADTDNDGVCDADDQCPGGDDSIDTDEDGVPDACDNCTQAGESCDDGNACTINDVYDAACNCAGIIADTDNDGVCDVDDQCPGGDDSIDTDEDGIPDACDNCTQAGESCDDGNACTINDVYDAACNCAGIIADTDNDGVCDADDQCPGGDDSIDTDEDGVPDACDNCTQAGESCDDGNACTINDVYDAACNCEGIIADTDNDGVCDADDKCPGGDDSIDTDEDGIPDACDNCTQAGESCDDGNACTINDVYDAACNCAGTIADTDNDGVCDADDQCPGGDDSIDTDEDGVPDACDNCTQAGESCDDGNACTINDVYDAACNCAGIIADTDNDGVCDVDDQCPGGDDSVDIDEDGIPDACDNCTQAGESCDDGNACTINDVYDAACNCAGIIADTDNDGVCDADDQCPGGDDSIDTDEDGVPDACDNCTQAGESCDDGNACTINDVYDAACNCEGIIADTDNDGVCDADDQCPGGDDSIDTDEDGVPDACDNCTQAGESCDDGNACTINDVYDAACNCAGTIADTDNDGVCDADDQCPGGDDSIDTDEDGVPDACDNCTQAGESCDDGNACTINDVYDAACNCAGTIADADNDGVCDADDQCPGGDDNIDTDEDGVPDACDNCTQTGESCDDGDICTINDQYNVDCKCVGVFVDTDMDGICDAEDICAESIDSDGDGTPDACDDCTERTTSFSSNELSYSGFGGTYITKQINGHYEPSFTIRDLGAKTKGPKKDRYIDIVEIRYVDMEGKSYSHGIYSGEVHDSLNIKILGAVKSISIILNDGYDQHASRIHVSLSEISYCQNMDLLPLEEETDGTDNLTPNGLYSLNVYPNPVAGAPFYVAFDAPEEEQEYTLMITDKYGRLHYEQKVTSNSNKVIVEFDANKFTAGVYLITLKRNSVINTKRIIILTY